MSLYSISRDVKGSHHQSQNSRHQDLPGELGKCHKDFFVFLILQTELLEMGQTRRRRSFRSLSFAFEISTGANIRSGSILLILIVLLMEADDKRFFEHVLSPKTDYLLHYIIAFYEGIYITVCNYTCYQRY